MAKKLNMTHIRKDYSKYQETTQIDFIENGETYSLTLYPFFKKERVISVGEQLVKGIQYAEKNNIPITDNLFFPFVQYQIIKEFTNLTTPKKPKDDLQFFIHFYNTDYFQTILDHMIPKEVEKVYTIILDMIADSERLSYQLEKYQEQIESLNLENPEIKKMIAERTNIDKLG